MTTPAKQTVGNFLNMPATNKFLEETLKEKKSEFVSNLLALTNQDEALSKCDPKEVMMCAINATALDLPLSKSLGHAFVIAYKNNKKSKLAKTDVYEPQFQVGTKGYKQLAMKSNYYQTMNHCNIRDGELTMNKFTGEFTFNEENPKGKIEGYFAFFKLLNGYTKSLYMTNEQLEAHAVKYVPLYRSDKAKGTKYSKWSTDERPAMEMKTVIKLLLSREGLLSTKMAQAISIENESDKKGVIRDITPLQEEEPPPQTDGKKKVNLKDIPTE